MSEKEHFDAGDFDLLLNAMELIPDLELTAYAAKLVREHLKYPINDPAELRQLFDNSGTAAFKETKLTFEQVEKYLPASFFPIEDERAFLLRAWLAFQRGRTIHALEDLQRSLTLAREKDDHTHLPTPPPFV